MLVAKAFEPNVQAQHAAMATSFAPPLVLRSLENPLAGVRLLLKLLLFSVLLPLDAAL